MEEDFTTKLLKFIGATLYTNVAMYAARELFGKSLFELKEQERKEVHTRLHDEFVWPAFSALTNKNLTPTEGGSASGMIH